uniref:Uncharacterized protein n=1 Tax=Caudovirales sp. gcode 4 TaxID=2838363 RepID=A0A8S5RTV3_9CAUD|nr:MAG TPA: hypothetical protein [Caudovirales sp. gcode 4]
MIRNLEILGNKKIWAVLLASYQSNIGNLGEVAFQWYVDGVSIEGANERVLQVLQAGEYVVAVLPHTSEGETWEMITSAGFRVEEFEIQEPIQKEYMIKLYDQHLNFVKVCPVSIVTNDISFSESINAGQGELTLNLNLPIDTNYFENVKYIKVFVNDSQGLEDHLIYSWYLSKYVRIYSNNRENIQAHFLSLFSLFNEIYYKQGGETTFRKNADPAVILREIVDQVSAAYPGLFSYTAESIVNYGQSVELEIKDKKCGDLIAEIVSGTNYRFFVWADGIIQYKPKPSHISHYFTYERDVKALTIPIDFEQVVNAVRVQYWYIGWPHSWITQFAENAESIQKFWRKEITIVNQSLHWEASANLYRDQYLLQNSKGKQNISLTVNSMYQLEKIHPWDLIKIRNLGVEVSGLQVSSVSYSYEQAVLKLEYTTSLWKELLSPS